jgi:hypothetical protein
MRIEVEEITPGRARDLLEFNTDNYREPDPIVIRRYALDMVHGNWGETGDSIKLSWPLPETGTPILLDGQQRLMACVEADTSFKAPIVRDLDPATADVMDWGKKRTLRNLLKRRGYKQSLALSGIINLSYRWENGLLFERVYPSPKDALTWVSGHPEAAGVTNLAINLHRRLGSPTSMIGAFALRAQAYAPEDEVTFRQQLVSGAGLDEGNAVFALRRWCLEGRGKESQGDTLLHLAIWVKAWNAFMTGRPLTTMVWRREGRQREPFPIMVDPRQSKKRSAAS